LERQGLHEELELRAGEVPMELRPRQEPLLLCCAKAAELVRAEV
jgi:hypothetical protein